MKTLCASLIASALLLAAAPAVSQPAPAEIGVVIMHGKGGSPSKHVPPLVSGLQGKGYLTANLEMPWSGARSYDVDPAGAQKEVEAALQRLRDKGAKKVFVAGHSQGGLFAVYLGGTLALDGVIAIAPGGSVSSPVYRQNIAEYLETARKLVAEGKGAEKARLFDHETTSGTYPIITTPANYVSWFDISSAMNGTKAMASVNPATPVLYLAPTNDYPGLQKVKSQLFGGLPKNPLTRMAQPASDHLGAPAASVTLIDGWIKEVVRAGQP